MRNAIFTWPNDLTYVHTFRGNRGRHMSEYRKLEHLTNENLKNAVVIDFEGLMDEDPSLAGILCDGNFSQVCFNPKLEKAAIAKDIEYANLESYLNELLDECVEDDRFDNRILAQRV